MIKNYIAGWVSWRIKKNKNAILVLNGPTGSGKSYAALKLGEDIAKELGTSFTIEGNVDFTFGSLLKKTMRSENQKPGTVFLFEEVGAFGGGASSREWQSKANKFFFSWAQTTRHRNQVIIFTTPMFTFLDASVRVLVHMQVIMYGINFKKKQSLVKAYTLQTNPRSGKTYFKLLRVIVEGVRTKLIGQRIELPSEKILKDYELMKTAYTDRLNQTIIDEEEKMLNQKKNGGRKTSLYEKNLDMCETMLGNGLTVAEIARSIGVSRQTIYNYKLKM